MIEGNGFELGTCLRLNRMMNKSVTLRFKSKRPGQRHVSRAYVKQNFIFDFYHDSIMYNVYLTDGRTFLLRKESFMW